MTDAALNEVKELLSYDPETGIFRWKASRLRGRKIGDVAGRARSDGYLTINMLGRTYYAHRLAWLYMTGSWPDRTVDHRDLNPSNNRWGNLRLATRYEQNRNTSVSANNRSGLKGAWRAKAGRWFSQITVDGRVIHLGRFDTAEEAHAAYVAAAKEHFGEFYRAA